MQSLGAAIQTLTLAATELGYGTCWMTSANYAAPEITEYLAFQKTDYFLSAIVPIGIPEASKKARQENHLKKSQHLSNKEKQRSANSATFLYAW